MIHDFWLMLRDSHVIYFAVLLFDSYCKFCNYIFLCRFALLLIPNDVRLRYALVQLEIPNAKM